MCQILFVVLVIVLSVLLFTSSNYPFGIFKFLVIILPVLLFTASYYPCGIFWSLYYLSFYLQLLITPVVSLNLSFVCSTFLLFVWIYFIARYLVIKRYCSHSRVYPSCPDNTHISFRACHTWPHLFLCGAVLVLLNKKCASCSMVN